MSNLYNGFYAGMPRNGHLEDKTPHCDMNKLRIFGSLLYYVIFIPSKNQSFQKTLLRIRKRLWIYLMNERVFMAC